MTTSAIIFQREKKLSHFKMLSHFQYLIQSNLMPLRSFVLTYRPFLFALGTAGVDEMGKKKTHHKSKLNCCKVQEHCHSEGVYVMLYMLS